MKNKREQLRLFADPKKATFGPDWFLIFKPSEKAQPLCSLGTLEFVYNEFNRHSETYADFLFAILYRPDGRIHRIWGKQPKK